ncbi:MAG TPA: SDR family NAD(P)-dependent oxidoreductase, partial [Ferruginibacter sp.]|nr:SDR family NAD(P)-dependent oxidoreductase [Ferruginibacter sp.]
MKFALVTGGSRGIGKAVCIRLASMGYHVLINYRSNEAEALQTLALVKEKGVEGEIIRFDVADKEQIITTLGGWMEANPDKTIEV